MPNDILESIEEIDLRLWKPQELQLGPPQTGSDDRWPRKTSRPVEPDKLRNEEERLLYRLSLLAMLR